MTEPLELADEPSLVALRCLPEEEVVAAQLLVGRVPLEDVVGDDQMEWPTAPVAFLAPRRLLRPPYWAE